MNSQNEIYEVPQIISVNEAHVPLQLLLDVSSSMAGEPIKLLNDAVNRFIQEVCKDERTREVLDVSAITFNHVATVYQEWAHIEAMRYFALTASGGTAIAPAVKLSLQKLAERVSFLKRAGVTLHKPWTVLISDGYGGDVGDVASDVRKLVADGKLNFFSLGVDGYDVKTLHALSGERVFELKDYDFDGFFTWLTNSMRAVSETSPDEKPQLPRLPDNVDKKDVSYLG